MSTDPRPPHHTGEQNMRLRVVLLALCVVVLVVAVWDLTRLVSNARKLGGNAVIEAIAYTEPVKAAVAQKLDGARGLFQTSLLVLAVLWGLVIAKRDERILGWRRGEWPEGAMFLIANVLFAATAYCYSAYTDAMATIHAIGPIQYDEPSELVIMDYRDSRINDLYVLQSWVWVGAMVVTALTLFSAHILKDHAASDTEELPACAPSPASA